MYFSCFLQSGFCLPAGKSVSYKLQQSFLAMKETDKNILHIALLIWNKWNLQQTKWQWKWQCKWDNKSIWPAKLLSARFPSFPSLPMEEFTHHSLQMFPLELKLTHHMRQIALFREEQVKGLYLYFCVVLCGNLGGRLKLRRSPI